MSYLDEPYNVYAEVEREARREARLWEGYGYDDRRDYDPRDDWDEDADRMHRDEDDDEDDARYEDWLAQQAIEAAHEDDLDAAWRDAVTADEDEPF